MSIDVGDPVRVGVLDARRDEGPEWRVRLAGLPRAGGDVRPGAGERRLVARVLVEPVPPAARVEERRPARGVAALAEELDRRRRRAGEPGVRPAVELRAEEGGEVIEVAVAVVDLGERQAVVERELAVARAQRREGVAVHAMRDAERRPGEAEGGLQRGSRGERERPDAERHGHGSLPAVPADADIARVLARRGVLRDEHLDPDGAALARGDAEGKGVASLALDLVHVRDERVRPAAGRAVERGRRVHLDERRPVEPDVFDSSRPIERAGRRPDVRRRARDDHLECLELVSGGGDTSSRGGARRRGRADLLGREGGPDACCARGARQGEQGGERDGGADLQGASSRCEGRPPGGLAAPLRAPRYREVLPRGLGQALQTIERAHSSLAR